MTRIVVYESMYGNTRAIAEAVATGLGGATVLSVHEAPEALEGVELLVVGGPTHMHGLTTALGRRMAVEGAQKHGSHVEPDAADARGLREWLADVRGGAGLHAAAFDTRASGAVAFTGSAARGIARRLRRGGFDVLATESFVVTGTEGPLTDGELERARAWGAALVRRLEGTPAQAFAGSAP